MDILHAPRVGAGAFLLGALGLAILASNPGFFPIIALGTILFGFCVGAEGDFLPFMVKRYFGMQSFGQIFGFFFFVYSLGGVIGPALYGSAFDRLGSYAMALTVASGLCAAAAVAIGTVGPYRFRAVTE